MALHAGRQQLKNDVCRIAAAATGNASFGTVAETGNV